jgi:crotonobetainyl-CoA:carnitine CoA-transferase CaiB-like acyl-CoA transferase
VGTFRTSDDRFVSLTCLQAAKYWAEACTLLGREDAAADPRFADAEGITRHLAEATGIVADAFAERTAAEWYDRLQSFSGQWAMVQHTLEAAADPQTIANHYIQDYETSAGVPYRLVTPPVQYDGAPPAPRRAPEFNEHGDDILTELGLDWDRIVDLKVRGVVA